MKDTVLSLSALCMIAAIYDQILHGRSIMRAVRMVLGIQICKSLFDLLRDCVSMLK